MKEDNKQKVTTGFLPFLPQEQCSLPPQRPSQSNQKWKQKQISKGNNDQERRRPRYDPIPMSYTHLLPILVKAGAIVPKQTEPAKLPYDLFKGQSIWGNHVEIMQISLNQPDMGNITSRLTLGQTSPRAREINPSQYGRSRQYNSKTLGQTSLKYSDDETAP
ncbi:hypothetical protein KIW84_055523 [Lathyrus oleraceus]|uniref:Uncharacterized protein n=1 Tax=Pisum sativum TaxID=3888 RepID=A0A9D4X0Q5_PEA|nr:hypothetical protein KIW84_055523 [Pisum sativum]